MNFLSFGTPVIAYRRGSVPEILREGETGFIVDDPGGAVAAVEKLDTVSRRRCRQVFEERFSARRMAHGYLVVYQAVIDASIRTRSAA